MLTGTFTLVARCERTGKLGVVTSTAIPAGGSICPFVTRFGALSTQSFNNYYFGIDGQQLLGEGLAADDVLDRLLTGDPGRELRQLLIVDAAGHSAAFTGSACVEVCTHLNGPNYAVGGNMLTDSEVIDAMADCFERESALSLVDRLMSALEAGQAAGGDKRGKQSAALKVVSPHSLIPVCDLRVDEHQAPVLELRRILEVAKVQLFPFLRSMPSRLNPSGTLSQDLAAYLARAVDDR